MRMPPTRANGMNGSPGSAPRAARATPESWKARFWRENSSTTADPRSSSVAEERVTAIPAAMEINRAGICETRPSPMVSIAKRSRASVAVRPSEVIPTASPPMRLTAVMMSPAAASPLTNLEAPSIAPKKSASRAISVRLVRASASVRRPALRSASMAICLPGMASRVNLAATSDTRDEPFVMTTNWMMTRIMNTISPTTSEPPTTD